MTDTLLLRTMKIIIIILPLDGGGLRVGVYRDCNPHHLNPPTASGAGDIFIFSIASKGVKNVKKDSGTRQFQY